MADLFTVKTDKTVLDKSQGEDWAQGVVIAAIEQANFLPGSPLISQQLNGNFAIAGANFLQQSIAFGEAVMQHVSMNRYAVAHYRSIWSGLQLAKGKQQFGYKTIFEVNGLPSIELKYHYPGLRESGLLQKIREIKNAKQTPVIICSVEAEQQKAFLVGAVEYFVKPINYKYLIEVLTNYRLRKDSNILLVDDDIPSLNLLREAVERNGFKAIAHSDSTKVLDSIQNMHLDLAIIDLDMSDIDGIELIERIKSYEQFKNLPVIIYTTRRK